eukprot:2492032-Rhodomonas_salina.3
MCIRDRKEGQAEGLHGSSTAEMPAGDLLNLQPIAWWCEFTGDHGSIATQDTASKVNQGRWSLTEGYLFEYGDGVSRAFSPSDPRQVSRRGADYAHVDHFSRTETWVWWCQRTVKRKDAPWKPSRSVNCATACNFVAEFQLTHGCDGTRSGAHSSAQRLQTRPAKKTAASSQRDSAKRASNREGVTSKPERPRLPGVATAVRAVASTPDDRAGLDDLFSSDSLAKRCDLKALSQTFLRAKPPVAEEAAD